LPIWRRHISLPFFAPSETRYCAGPSSQSVKRRPFATEMLENPSWNGLAYSWYVGRRLRFEGRGVQPRETAAVATVEGQELAVELVVEAPLLLLLWMEDLFDPDAFGEVLELSQAVRRSAEVRQQTATARTRNVRSSGLKRERLMIPASAPAELPRCRRRACLCLRLLVASAVLWRPMDLTTLRRRTRAASARSLLALILALMVVGVCRASEKEKASAEEVRQEFFASEFLDVRRVFWTRPVARSGPVYELQEPTEPFEFQYPYGEKLYDIDDFNERTGGTGLVVLHGNKILYERYDQGATRDSRLRSYSVAKSVVSTLVGIAVGDGLIASVEDPVTRYLGELRGSGYDGVSIKDVLHMATGMSFGESYADIGEDFFKLTRSLKTPEARLGDVPRKAVREGKPGTAFHYSSNDTVVLGWLLAKVTGKCLSTYMAEKLWGPLGAEKEAFWIIDKEGPEGVEAAFMGFNATLRDYARWGLLMASDGILGETRILPRGWVAEATIPDRPFVQCGKLYKGYDLGYQYHWWCFPGADHAFTAQGGFGQFVLVNPELDLVMVKISNWPTVWVLENEFEIYALFRALEARLREEHLQKAR